MLNRVMNDIVLRVLISTPMLVHVVAFFAWWAGQ